MPPIPPPPSTDGPHWSMPPQVQSCEDAAKNGNIQRVKELVQQLLQSSSPSSEAVEPQPKWFHGALTAAINRHDLDMVQYLLDENVATQDNHYVFEGTVRGRAFNVLELLLQRGWDINKTPTRVEPPVLTVAIWLGDKDMIIWLLDHGGDPNARCAWDYTPTSNACWKSPLDTIDYLFTRGADARRGELLQWAILRESDDALDVVRRCVELGAPFDKVKYEDDPRSFAERIVLGLGTPLHRAAEFGKVEIVKYLLELGADPFKLDTRKKTPRHWADIKGHRAVVDVLIHAEDQRIKRASGQTSNS